MRVLNKSSAKHSKNGVNKLIKNTAKTEVSCPSNKHRQAERPSARNMNQDECSGVDDDDLEDDDSGVESVNDGIEESNIKKAIKRKNDDQGAGSTNLKQSKLSEAALIKPPTASELYQLRETENLFHSNLFRLQIEEILKEIKPKPKYITSLQQWLEKLKTGLLSLKSSKKNILSNPNWVKQSNIEVPFPDNFFKNVEENLSKSSGAFVTPSCVSIIGSFASECFVGPDIQVDIKVEMPKECVGKDDELNYGYHRKRALYLCYIASQISTLSIVGELHFSQCRNSLNPTLEIKPSGKLGKSVTVNIHVVLHPDSFKLVRFAPSKSKISSKWYFSEGDKFDDVNKPTPHYNSSVLQDLTLNANEECMNGLSACPNIRDGIILLKIWLRQLQLIKGYGGFSGHIMSLYVIHLLRARRLNKLMSSYQIVRNVWNCLAQSDWVTSGITLVETKVENQPSMVEFHKHFEVVFVDVTGFYNLCADMSKETFIRVKHESMLAVKCLDNPNINSFVALFLTPKPLYLQCDHIIRLRKSTVTKLVMNHSAQEYQVDYSGAVYPQALSLILRSLRRGLEQRVSLICIQLPDVPRWPISHKLVTCGRITLGFVLNPEFAFNILDKGPEANVMEAEEFRSYWGDKCELRRFPDGSITEVLSWGKLYATMSQKRLITREVVKYLLSSKLGINPENFTYLADQFEPLLESPQVKPSEFEYGTGEEAAVQAIRSFDSLTKQLRELSDLPLDVSTVQGSAAVFRYTDAYPPLAGDHVVLDKGSQISEVGKSCLLLETKMVGKKLPRYIQPIEAVIQLGMSGKWPDDLGAIRRIQAAFYLAIAKQLTEDHKLTTQPYPDHVDILKDGFVFRLLIGNQRETTFLKKVVSPEGVTKFKDTEESIALEKQIEHLPKLTGALHGLHMQFPGFGPACCLAKRWLRCHLLDAVHFPDECIELLVATLFLRPQPFTPPAQPQVAFFRFLRLIAETNWNTECLILNLNEELTRDDFLEIEGAFNKNRTSLPPLFIATSFDHSGSVWTTTAPTLQILIRAAQLASESLKIINTSFFTAKQSSVNVYQLFRPETVVYDAVIHIISNANARFLESIPADKPKVYTVTYRQMEKIPVVGFNPVQCYVDQLREVYEEVALFFFDPYGGDKIGVLWKPLSKEIKDFKVSHVNYHKLVGSSQLAVNVEAIIEDFFILGNGLVKTIETKPSTSIG